MAAAEEAGAVAEAVGAATMLEVVVATAAAVAVGGAVDVDPLLMIPACIEAAASTLLHYIYIYI